MRKCLSALVVVGLFASGMLTASPAGAADPNNDIVDRMTIDISRRTTAVGVLTDVGDVTCPAGANSIYVLEEYTIDGAPGYAEWEVFRETRPTVFADFDAGLPVVLSISPVTDAPPGDFEVFIACLDAADALLGSARFELEVIALSFTDVERGTYYEVPSLWALVNEVTTGTGPETFDPSGEVTRWQMALFLQRLADVAGSDALSFPTQDTFDDTIGLDPALKRAIGWLAAARITTGTSPTTFSPDQPVTRVQMALFLRRFAVAMGLDTSGAAQDTFTDTAGLNAIQREAIGWLAATEITTGVGGGRFDPNGTVTRAQMVTFLMRLHDLVRTSANDDA